MRHRIYLENHRIALLAEEECNKEAQKHGFKYWTDWYKHEQHNDDLDYYYRPGGSHQEMMRITNEFRDKYKDELKKLGFL